MPTEEQRKLRALRRTHNIKQRELAAELGVSQTIISAYETLYQPSPERYAELLAAIQKLANDGSKRSELRIY